MGSADQHREVGGAAEARSPSDVLPRLVFGDDGSADADVVWLWINNHRWPGWRVSVVTAEIPDSLAPVGAERAAPHPWEPPYPRRLLSDDGVQLEHLFAESDPRLALDSCSDATLLAVGPRGRGVLKHLHIGSTTEWLIGAHRPLTPVVVVRSARPTKKVLLCMDGSDHARSALAALLDLPWLANCRVAVLGVDDSRHRTGDAVQEAAKALQAAGVADVKQDVVKAVRHTAGFDVRSAILSTIEDTKPDLIAVGARGTGGIRGLLVGSVATAVVHHAPCSVLVAKTS